MDDPLEQFAGVYDRYYRNVLRYSLQHAEQGTAEDVTSETFLIAWRRFSALPDPPLPWLLGVARNLLRKQAGAGLRRRELVSRIAALSTPADGFTVGAGDFVVERAAAVAALSSLPRRDIEALTLIGEHTPVCSPIHRLCGPDRCNDTRRGKVVSTACHGGIGALRRLRVGPRAGARADHRPEPADDGAAKSRRERQGVAGSRRTRARGAPGRRNPDVTRQGHPDRWL